SLKRPPRDMCPAGISISLCELRIRFTLSTAREEKSSGKAGAFRRIVVGLWSQENALPLADAVIALFEDRLISPYLDSFKMLLSFNPTKPRPERELLKGRHLLPRRPHRSRDRPGRKRDRAR